MDFKQYMHIERFGTDDVGGIELGVCYIFPKIDGTNGSAWLSDGCVCAGSRRRKLLPESDNAGFYQYVSTNQAIKDYLKANPTHRLYGEWLVPHSLKTYRADAWRKFYVFDVAIDRDGENEYLSYDLYQPLLDEYGLDYIPPLMTIKNGSYETFVKQLDNNVFLIEDGKGSGEGIVIKNYEFKNKFGRTVWGKIVRSEFKEIHAKTMGAPTLKGKDLAEESIVDLYCTEALIDKTYAKIVNERGGWSSRFIPQLLGTVYHDLVTEELWNAIKKLKYPTVNFKTLNYFTINKIKQIKPEIFT